MKKKLVFALLILVLFTTYKPQKLFLNINLNIGEIIVENNLILKENEIKKDLAFLYERNLFFLNTSGIEKVLKKNDFIKSIEIKKIYPNKLKIKIFEKKPILILQNKKEKFFIDEDINLINYLDLEEYKNLPIVFGKKENFKILYRDLKKTNFPIDLIENYYLFESNRWDLKTYKKKIIKLPSENYIKSLKNFIDLRKENNLNKYKVFDYRIDNQLILK
jgi:cell division septal protein FtsQ|tara:strand:- start:23 stop:679 length:657 start_codon:yes stop_codon:yes gene_type:complete